MAPSVVEYAELGTGASAFGMGVCTVLLCVLSVYAIVEGCGIGRARKRDTPQQEWDKGRWVGAAKEIKREGGKREDGGERDRQNARDRDRRKYRAVVWRLRTATFWGNCVFDTPLERMNYWLEYKMCTPGSRRRRGGRGYFLL